MFRQTGASDASVTPCARSVQVGEFEVAIHGGIWVAIGARRQQRAHQIQTLATPSFDGVAFATLGPGASVGVRLGKAGFVDVRQFDVASLGSSLQILDFRFSDAEPDFVALFLSVCRVRFQTMPICLSALLMVLRATCRPLCSNSFACSCAVVSASCLTQVRSTTRCSSLSLDGAPPGFLLRTASQPVCNQRLRQSYTVSRLRPNSRAIAGPSHPSAKYSSVWDHSRSLQSVPRLTICSSRRLSSALNSSPFCFFMLPSPHESLSAHRPKNTEMVHRKNLLARGAGLINELPMLRNSSPVIRYITRNKGKEISMRGLKNVKKLASVGAAGLALIALPAHAVYTVSIAQSGADVVATGSGTLNTAALTAGGGFGCSATGFIRASNAILCFSNGGIIYTGITGPANFGAGGSTTGSSVTGTGVTMQTGGSSLGLPAAYVSNSALSGTVTWTGKTISSLGLTPGTYTWTWGTGGTADSYVITITDAPAPVAATVPTLSEYGLIALASLMAMGGIWAMRKRGQI